MLQASPGISVCITVLHCRRIQAAFAVAFDLKNTDFIHNIYHTIRQEKSAEVLKTLDFPRFSRVCRDFGAPMQTCG